jgi:hypothetical protein
MPMTERFQKIDPYLSDMVVGAKVTRHGAMVTGAKTLTRVADVAGSWCRDLWRQAWRHRSRRQDPVLKNQPLFLLKALCLVLVISDNA